MPVDPSKALGASLGEGKYSYTKNDVILYHLGVGYCASCDEPEGGERDQSSLHDNLPNEWFPRLRPFSWV